jgi:curved DNA-binding protein CbpA
MSALSPYEVLLVLGERDPRGITFEECKSAYQKLCLKHHPDKNKGGQSESSSNKFLEVQAAWDLIGSVEKKEMYDKGYAANHANVTRSDEVPLSAFLKERVMIYDEADGTEKEGWLYKKECRCGDVYEITEFDLTSGFNTTQCLGCSLYCTVVV